MTASTLRSALLVWFGTALPALMALGIIATPTSGAARPLTAKDLVGLNRVSEARVSPDGERAVYDLAVLDAAANKRVHSIWMIATDGKGAPVKLADGSSPRWSPGDRFVYYTAPVNGVQQVWRVDTAHPDKTAHPVTGLPLDVDSFRIAPDGRTLVVSMAVFPDADDPTATKAKATRRPRARRRARSTTSSSSATGTPGRTGPGTTSSP